MKWWSCSLYNYISGSLDNSRENNLKKDISPEFSQIWMSSQQRNTTENNITHHLQISLETIIIRDFKEILFKFYYSRKQLFKNFNFNIVLNSNHLKVLCHISWCCGTSLPLPSHYFALNGLVNMEKRMLSSFHVMEEAHMYREHRPLQTDPFNAWMEENRGINRPVNSSSSFFWQLLTNCKKTLICSWFYQTILLEFLKIKESIK